MESLVDYEDSDSDCESSITLGCSRQLKENQDMTVSRPLGLKPTESHPENIHWTSRHGRIPSVQTDLGSALVKSHISTEGLPALPEGDIGWDRQYTPSYTDKPLLNISSRVAIASPDPLEKTTSQQTSSGPSQIIRHKSSDTVKRPQHVSSGIRPYISKRQRLGPTSASGDMSSKQSVEEASTKQTRCVLRLSEVCERVKPYLLEKPGAAGIPRRLLRGLEGHEGPVNTVHWCPVAQLSHLLLSASMDKKVKVWDAVESGQCLGVYPCHAEAVRDACWTPCGRRFLSGSFDNKAAITDVETGQQLVKVDNQFKVMCVALQPSDEHVFLCGGYSPVVKAWDARVSKAVKLYSASIQQTLAILFLKGGREFITSTDSVSRDSAERTLIAWDYQTTARLSNQIFHERYTCPGLALHPTGDCFLAQTNGNYMAVFSSQRPYRMNKRRRYEGHKVEGYAVQCELSADGTVLATGSSSGSAHFYDYQSTRMVHTLCAHRQPCLRVAQHPVLPSTAATCDWGGEVKVWH
ncbi:WD repeat-containing protein 25 [Gadus chalcogrammus]|uniref:WD repeat-containing protein 25 n=1 Tax=Gadus chalcogrammus TaxID=1042646 RepID=UPI0024C304F3|nr:WD repeat-containing protein 25 [Gadus chalcogrammus]